MKLLFIKHNFDRSHTLVLIESCKSFRNATYGNRSGSKIGVMAAATTTNSIRVYIATNTNTNKPVMAV
jgi:hypothetical protein